MDQIKNNNEFKKDALNKFYSISPQKDDIVIMEYNASEISPDELIKIFKFILKATKNKYQIVGLPDVTTLKTMDNAELLELRDVIDSLLANK